MLITLSDLSSRIETVRRAIDDRSGLAVVRLRVNGEWAEATRETFIIDDSGAILIDVTSAEEPTLVTMVKDEAITLIPNQSFRQQSIKLMEESYFEIFSSLKPLWDKCGRSSKSAEWIPIPDGLTLDQRCTFLNGIRSEIEEMIDDLAFGVAHSSDARNLIYQWTGAKITGFESKYEDDIASLKSRLTS